MSQNPTKNVLHGDREGLEEHKSWGTSLLCGLTPLAQMLLMLLFFPHSNTPATWLRGHRSPGVDDRRRGVAWGRRRIVAQGMRFGLKRDCPQIRGRSTFHPVVVQVSSIFGIAIAKRGTDPI
jgi:hypothetical protein